MIRSICVDTLTGIQSDEYMADKTKPGHDKWKDYGQSIYTFIAEVQKRGFEIIMILGEPGTGKSSGQRTLVPSTNIWYNADKKNPIWVGGREEYGRKNAPRKNFHMLPSSYKEILDHIDLGLNAGKFEEDRYAFITGHTETYKVGFENKERLKVLGNMATKMQLEGKMESVFYSRVEMDGGKPTYILETQNNGNNTARSPQGVFEGKIPNDYQLILEALSNYYNGGPGMEAIKE